MRVSIFGIGYVGLVTGACLADVGHDVVCVDIDAARVGRLNDGEVPIFEPGLAPIVQSGRASGRLRFTTDAAEAIAHGEVVFIAVGTPPDEDGSADLTHVLAVADTVGRHLASPTLVVDKSTVPVGTADAVRARIAAALADRGADVAFEVVSNPEFLKEGAAVEDFMRPDRIVLGADSDEAIAVLRRLYAPFNRNRDRIVAMDVRSAELTKYAANAMLATKISFMNEIANIAAQVGADVERVRQGIGSDPRIGYHFIYPGAGYGGSCFPKDVRALANTARRHGVEPRLLDAVESVNASQKQRLPALVAAHYGGDAALRGKTFAVWGLAFKPNTDDLREASSRTLVAYLRSVGAQVRAYDPEAADGARVLFEGDDGVVLCASADEALADADALVLVTEWREFRGADPQRLARVLRDRVVFDGRNVFVPEEVEAAGVAYYGIGRGRRPGAAA